MPDRRTIWLAMAAGAGLLVSLPDAGAQSGGRGGSGVGSGIGAGSGIGGFGAGASSFGRSTGSFTTSPSSPAPTRGALPPSAIGTPAPQVPSVAPLSPPTTSTFLGSGGVTVTTPGGTTTTINTPGGLSTPAPGAGTIATFPGGGGGSTSSLTTGSISPSESAPSRPGGGAPGVQGCMSFWDAGTHMTKREWAAACRRIENRLQDLKSVLDASVRTYGRDAAAPRTEQRPRTSRSRVSRGR